MVRAAHAFGLDLAHHRSQAIDWTTLDETELIITMMRRHVREVVVHDVGSWSKTFTFRELVRRGRVVGARGSEESLADWVAKVHEGRMVTAMMGDDPSDDVADPMGGNPDDFDATVEILYGLVHELTDLVWPAMPS
jgi:protein-tyrosine-phosphatase